MSSFKVLQGTMKLVLFSDPLAFMLSKVNRPFHAFSSTLDIGCTFFYVLQAVETDDGEFAKINPDTVTIKVGDAYDPSPYAFLLTFWNSRGEEYGRKSKCRLYWVNPCELDSFLVINIKQQRFPVLVICCNTQERCATMEACFYLHHEEISQTLLDRCWETTIYKAELIKVTLEA